MTFISWWRNVLHNVQYLIQAANHNRKRKVWQNPIRRRCWLSVERLENRYAPATASAILTGTTFFDSNGNGVMDNGETPLPGVAVTLTGTTTQGTAVNTTATTTAQGKFTISNVLPGTYQLSGHTASFINGKSSLGNINGADGTGIVTGITIAGGETLNGNFGFKGIAPAGISMRLFLASSTPASFAIGTPGTGTATANYRPNNTPIIATDIDDFAVGQNSANTLINLAGHFSDPDYTNSQVRLNTSAGAINLELFDADAPQTVANFFNYILSGAYNNSIFHRLEPQFVLQGGGYTFTAGPPANLVAIPANPAVPNEFGASNTQWTVAMAKLPGDPNSATSQFFINLVNNASNLDNQNGGFTVFGELAGAADQAVVNAIRTMQIHNQGAPFDNIPLNNYTGNNFPADTTLANYVVINSVTVVKRDEFLTYSIVSNTNPGLVTATLNPNANEVLTLQYTPNQSGSATITVRATDRFGASVDASFTVTVDAREGTTTSLTSSANPAVFGQEITFTATVSSTAPGADTPTGTVTFRDGNTVLGTAALTNGTATFDTSALALGSHTITAIYSGDDTFFASTSAVLVQTINTAGTTTNLAVAPNPAQPGQEVTFSATVAAVVPGSGVPTGTVTFLEGSTSLGIGTLQDGVATFSTTSLSTEGTSHTITAIYGGDANFATSTSQAVTLIISDVKEETTTTLGTAASSIPANELVNITVTVAAVSGTPTGTVTFLDGDSEVGTQSLNAEGRATFTFSFGTIGAHTLSAVYSGDDNFAPSASEPFVLTVQQTSTVTLTSDSPESIVFGETLTFTATVVGQISNDPPPTGVVTFQTGDTPLGTAELDENGVATFSTNTLSVAGSPHTITAIYGGDVNVTSSQSNALVREVHEASSVVLLASSDASSVFGQTVTFTASLSAVSPASSTPTGSVTFFEGDTELGFAQIDDNGVATFATANLSVSGSPHQITAVYGGDSNFTASTSEVLVQEVAQAQTTTVLVSSNNPSTVGEEVTFTATVAAVAPGSGTPTGFVTFFAGEEELGTAELNDGTATLSISNLTVAGSPHLVTASYSGDDNFSGSTSEPHAQTVLGAETIVVLVSSLNPSAVDEEVTFTATVTAVDPGFDSPTGFVTFFANGTELSVSDLDDNGIATFTTSNLNVEGSPHTILAVYGGDDVFAGSTSNVVLQVVT